MLRFPRTEAASNDMDALALPDSKPERRNSPRLRLLFWVIFVAALALRLWFLVDHLPSRNLESDMGTYGARAANLLNGTLGPWDTFTPVGYPLFLAVVYAISRGNVDTVGLIQCFLGAATAALTYDVFYRVSRRALASALCGAIVAVHVPLIYYASYQLSETVFAFLLIVHVSYLLRTIEAPSASRALIAGLALGAASIVRSNLLTLIALVPVFAWFAARRSWPSFRRYWCYLVVAALFPVSIVSIHNSRLLGHATGVASNGALNFYMNFSEVSSVNFKEGDFVHYNQPIPNALRYEETEFVPVPFYDEGYFYARGSRLIAERPGRLLRALRNFREAASVGQQGYWPEWASQTESVADYSRWFFGLIIVPAVLRSLWLTARFVKRKALGDFRVLLVAVIASGCLSIYLFLGDPRMRVPLDPFLVMLTAELVVASREWWLRRNHKSVAVELK